MSYQTCRKPRKEDGSKRLIETGKYFRTIFPVRVCNCTVKHSAAFHDWSLVIEQKFDLILADGIFVRVYEDRMDLLRAVIAGAYGTPYQDGLFFFDFHLPPDYPSVPPV